MPCVFLGLPFKEKEMANFGPNNPMFAVREMPWPQKGCGSQRGRSSQGKGKLGFGP